MEVILLGVLLFYPSTWSRLLLASLVTLILLLIPFQPATQAAPPANQVPPAIVGEMAVSQIQQYVHSVAVSDLVSYLHDQDVRAAQEATRPVSQAPVSTPQTVTGSCGGATNGADQYIARESGGDPTATNPSGARGCYQIMPGTWAGSCSDLGDQYSATPATQAECASRLPLSAWAL